MSYYRLYFMDELSGHVTQCVELLAENDAEASERAQSHRCHRAMELWCGATKVKRWPPDFSTAR
jgi:hypothetical protein